MILNCATFGKVLDWLTKLKAISLKDCRIFVLDEADVMIATQGHQVIVLANSRCLLQVFSLYSR